MIPAPVLLILAWSWWPGPGTALADDPLAWTRSGRATYVEEPTIRKGRTRMAYQVAKDEKGNPFLEASAFLVMEVAFYLTNAMNPWPPICDESWAWNAAMRGFVLLTSASPPSATTPPCVFRGTVFFKGTLLPRIDVTPSVSVVVSGAQGDIPVPVRVTYEMRSSLDWTGTPVFLGELSTTVLADGLQRFHITGGYREIEIDGNPGTPEFEEGGDNSVSFLVQNAPPRLMELTVLTGSTSASAYTGVWNREPSPGGDSLVLRREGGRIVRVPGSGESPVLSLVFSVPVCGVRIEMRKSDDSWFSVDAENADGTTDVASVWTAHLDPDQLTDGRWSFRISARDSADRPLERLRGTRIPARQLGTIQPESGACLADGKPCDLGPDETHSITVARP